jgi:hypothetical protein
MIPQPTDKIDKIILTASGTATDKRGPYVVGGPPLLSVSEAVPLKATIPNQTSPPWQSQGSGELRDLCL